MHLILQPRNCFELCPLGRQGQRGPLDACSARTKFELNNSAQLCAPVLTIESERYKLGGQFESFDLVRQHLQFKMREEIFAIRSCVSVFF